MQISRHWARRAVASFLGGTLVVGAAWAGVGLSPHTTAPASDSTAPKAPGQATAAAAQLNLTAKQAGALTPPDLTPLRENPLDNGLFYVGADETSIAPDASLWQTQGCSEYGSRGAEEATRIIQRLADGKVPPGWPKSDDCVYLGGYGIGPARAATGSDPHTPVAVRSIAISNGTDTVVWQMVDVVGFFSVYRSDLCNPGCGILDIREQISKDTGIPVANVAVGATHTHGGADGYGAWGGLPDWYRVQLRDAVVESAYNALRNVKVASIHTGEVDARNMNSERRDTYRSSPDYGLVWLQARDASGGGNSTGGVIATLVNYAAHPVVLGDQGLMHGDWPATASQALSQTLGGTGMVYEGGLGNVSPSSRAPEADYTGDGTTDDYDEVIQMGRDFAAAVKADIDRGGHRMPNSVVKAVNSTISHPSTNMAENGLSFGGLLDRDFLGERAAGGPGEWHGGKKQTRPCVTASSNTIKTDVSGYRIGDLRVLTAPGEIFSAVSLAIKSRTGRGDAANGGQVMVFGQTQDSLGYIIQSFEVDPAGGVLTNAGGHVEYEETFMLDRCFGDHVLEEAIALAGQL